MKKMKYIVATATLAFYGSGAIAADDSKTTREREALRRAQQALQAAQQQNADLARAKAEAEAKLRSSVDQIDTAQSGIKSAQFRSASLQNELKKTQNAQAEISAQLEDTRKQLNAMTEKQNQTALQLIARENEVKQANLIVERRQGEVSSCEARNAKLYEYSQTLLKRYNSKGVWDVLQQKEPVVGIKRVEIENVLQEYQDKLDAQKIDTGKSAVQ